MSIKSEIENLELLIQDACRAPKVTEEDGRHFHMLTTEADIVATQSTLFVLRTAFQALDQLFEAEDPARVIAEIKERAKDSLEFEQKSFPESELNVMRALEAVLILSRITPDLNAE